MGLFVFLLLRYEFFIIFLTQVPYQKYDLGWVSWFTPVILAIQETEIRNMKVQKQPRQKASDTPISTNKSWLW
jgi:hypothetical protein